MVDLGERDPVAFVGVTDPARSESFYVGLLGLSLVESTPYGVAVRSGRTTVRLTPIPDHRPAQGTALGWEVTDLATAVTDLIARGVTFRRFDGMDQDQLGIWTSPSGARVAWFEDPDTNLLSLTQP